MRAFLSRLRRLELRRLETKNADIREQGPSRLEMLRERERLVCITDGEEPPPTYSREPLLDDHGEPFKSIRDILRHRD